MSSPASLGPGKLPAYDVQACRTLMRGGSKTFFAASLMLPARVRAPARALYAFCRLSDDEIDLGADSAGAMRCLHERLDAVYAGQPQAIDVDRALASVVHGFALPRPLLDALLEGFLWDAAGRTYETLDDVQAYAARVAGSVGAMMSLVMGARDSSALARACDLGVAMQLTNIARDVGEDARNGRLYLPRQWMREAGIDPQGWLQAPSFSAALGCVIQRLLSVADALYQRAEDGIAALPRDCRPAIQAARLVYAEIGRQIEHNGLDSIGHRAVVSRQRKLALLARATGAAVVSPGSADSSPPALAPVQFLVDAAAGVPPPHHSRAASTRRSFDERAGWVIGLCERQAAKHQRAFP